MTGDPTPFDLTGPLPRGTAVLEASAGTGKTYAIAALATRYVAEAGVPLGQLLLVTFTRAAAAELRERVRRRLVQAASHLEAVLEGIEVAGSDEVLDHLAAGSRAQLTIRHRRLVDAITELETATITTIHGFCQQVLHSIGLAADVPRDATLLEDERDLLEQVVGDRMVARFTDRPGAPRLQAVLAAARAAASDPDARLLPVDPPADDDAAGEDADATSRLIAQVAREARDELASRKRAAGVLSHHDLLTRLRDATRDPDTGAAAVQVLRDRYRVALIDEFQDTDPVQWEILDRALGTGAHGRDAGAPGSAARAGSAPGSAARAGDDRAHAGAGRADGAPGSAARAGDDRALVLIGDPKQAIYAFRGADVRAYLDATSRADARHTLSTSWRCDGPLVSALNRFFAGTVYGDAGIVQRDLEVAPGRQESSLGGDPALTTPLTLRVVTAVGASGKPPTSSGVRETLVPADVAAQIGRMLGDGALSIDGRPAEPGDIAVLVRANRDAAILQQVLRRARIPAVINGVGSVFATPAAHDLHQLLDTLERPSSPTAARRLAVTDFGGWSGHELATAGDDAWDAFHERLHTWAATLREHGVAALLRRVAGDTTLAARVLATVGGERRLTDLRHVGRLLHAAELDGERGATAVAAWLGERIAAADEAEIPPDEQARRLESDAHAVQILTVHRSKGLEFPIVLCPYLWVGQRNAVAPLSVHDPEHGGRVIDVGPSGRTGFETSRERWKGAERGEDLRLLYVAMTRARHRVVAWWVVPPKRATSALGTVLFSREDERVHSDREGAYPKRDATLAVLEAVAAECGGSAEQVPGVVDLPAPHTTALPAPELAAAELRRAVDRTWRRTSYSGIVGSNHPEHADVEAAVDDEDLDAGPSAAGGGTLDDTGRDLRTLPLPLAEVRGGTGLGTMLHEVMEHTDFAAADLEVALARQLASQLRRHGMTDDDREALLTGTLAAIRTPLGPLAGDRALAEITLHDRLDEPRFELPLAGGDTPQGRRVTVGRIADLVERHLPASDPLAGYHRRLRDRRFRVELRGYLNGAIDLVLRVPGHTPGETPGRDLPDDGPPSDGPSGGGPPGDESRYLVVDYKTNRLGWPEVPTAWHYRPAALAQAMQDGHYPLQALIYAVALHRLLRWRVPGYDPERHLGGVAYLFMRGMTGPDVPRVGGQPCGVFSWRPPTALVTDLSDLLDGRREGDR